MRKVDAGLSQPNSNRSAKKKYSRTKGFCKAPSPAPVSAAPQHCMETHMLPPSRAPSDGRNRSCCTLSEKLLHKTAAKKWSCSWLDSTYVLRVGVCYSKLSSCLFPHQVPTTESRSMSKRDKTLSLPLALSKAKTLTSRCLGIQTDLISLWSSEELNPGPRESCRQDGPAGFLRGNAGLRG